MQGSLEKHKRKSESLPQPRTSPERTYEILGHPPWHKGASRRANAHCLRPQAEFARASGRGLSRVKIFIKDAKGMCKKEKDRELQ